MRHYHNLLVRLGATRWFSWLSATVLAPIDRFVYSRSGGRMSLGHFGANREGALQTLLLTSTGRKTGKVRTNPVLYLDEGNGWVVVASNFGREHHPGWSSNLIANPDAEVQIRTRHERVRARLASAEELARLWPRLLELYPSWDAYVERTDRSFRAFFLEPRG
jgi:deazaflavin-dependent oxidoreductase (nitroreductase family)